MPALDEVHIKNLKGKEYRMKKKLLALTLCLGMITVAFSGCGKKSDKNGEDATEAKKVTKAELTVEKEDYFGLEVEESDTAVTDEELEKYIESDLQANSTTEEVKEGILEKDMDVNIDYTGTVDGQEYTSKTGSVLKLTDGSFVIDGFVEGLIGKSVGEEVKLSLKFAEDYEDDAYAGKDIEFTVKINSIVVTKVPELNDEYVKNIYGYLSLATVDEYKEEYRRNIRVNKIYAVVWPAILENVEIKSYDSEELDKLAKEIAEQQEYSMSLYGLTLDSYLEAVGQTKEEFLADCEEAAKEQLASEMIAAKIAEMEGITVTDEEYAEELKKTMVAYEIETEEEFYEYFADYGYDEAYFKKSFLTNKVIEFVCDNIVVVDDKPETESETSAE